MSKLLLIDGHSIANRAFYGVPDLTNSAGEHTGAIFGFLNMMFKFIDDEQPDNLAVAGHFPFYQADEHGFIVCSVDFIKQRFFSLGRIFAALLRIAENELGFSGGEIQVVQHSPDIFILRAADQRLSAVFHDEFNVLDDHLPVLLRKIIKPLICQR